MRLALAMLALIVSSAAAETSMKGWEIYSYGEADIRQMISLNACRLMGLPEPQRAASAAPAARA